MFKAAARGICAALLIGALAGCADPKDKRIAELQSELDKARADLNERDRQINDLALREEDSQAAVRNLNKELAALREQAAKARDVREGEWTSLRPGLDMISIPGEVLFDSGKAVLKPTGRNTLDRISSDIRSQFADRDIYVIGHTDDEPIRKSGWKDNWQLGAERALTAARTLISSGISPSRIVQANCGEFRPAVPNTSAASRQKNRRVEFYAVSRGGASGGEGSELASPER